MSPDPYRLQVLGEPGLSGPDGGRVDLPLGKPFALLCYLALRPDAVTRDRLTDLLWSGAPRDRARASLRQALWLLRKSVSDDTFEVEGETIRVRGGRVRSDLENFRARLATGDLEAAVRLWGDGPFAGFTVPDSPDWNYWADEVRTRLEDHLLRVLHDRALARLDSRHSDDALRWLDAALAVRPHSGEAHALRIETLLELRELERAEGALLEARSALEGPDTDLLADLEEKLRHLRRTRFRQGGPTLTTELVGRSDAFARLSECWRNALAGRTRLAALLGPPGIGKTRLAEEFIDFALLEDARVVTARGVHAEARLDWSVVADLTRKLYRLPGAAGIGTASHAILGHLVPTLEGTGAADPEGATTLQPAALADAVADLVRAVSHEQPLLVVVDDLHRVDPPSRGLLSHLVRAVAGARVLLLVTSPRSGDEPGAVQSLRMIEESPGSVMVPLPPLSRAEIREMLGFLGDVGDHDRIEALTERVERLTRGSPLLVRELLEALRGRGLLREEADGTWSFAPELEREELPVPDAVRRSLRERVAGSSRSARELVRRLAVAGQPVLPGTLQMAGLEDEVRLAAEEVLERGLARVTPDGRLDVAHEEVRQAILGLPEPRSEIVPSARPSRTALAGAAVLVLLVLAGATMELLRASGGAVAPFGGGLLLIGEPDGAATFRPQPDGSWSPGPTLETPPGIVLSAYGWDASGTSLQAVGYSSRDVETPYAVRVDQDGRWTPLFVSPEDAGATALSPDGRHVLLNLADPRSDVYRVDAVRMDMSTGDTTHLLAHPALSSGRPNWSPDGTRIAMSLNLAHDSLVVLRPDGRRIAGLVTPDRIISQASWCASADRLVLATLQAGGGPRLWSYDLSTGELSAVPTAVPPVRPVLACSPDGQAFAYLGRVEGDARVLVQGWGGQILARFPTRGSIRRLDWIPDPPPRLPARVQLAQPGVQLGWGERRPIRATVLDQRGAVLDSARVRWISRDPAVASVLPGGELSGNGRGKTRIVAEVDGWIRDSLAVTVAGAPTASVLWSDPLAMLDPTRWAVFGSPAPRPVRRNGRDLLLMTGDGVFNDGIYTRKAFRLPRGGTVQLSFHLPLTRTDRQAVSLCLSGLRPEEVGPGDRLLDHHRYVCFGYPAQQGVDHDRSEIGFATHLQVTGPIRVPELLPTDDWVTAALQLRADGQPSLFLNGRHVRTFDLSVANGPDTRWRVFIGGRSVDTELLIRDVVVWNEERYPSPDPDPTGAEGSDGDAAPDDGEPGEGL